MRPRRLPPDAHEKAFRKSQKRRKLTAATRDPRLSTDDPRAEERVEKVLTILLDAAANVLESEDRGGDAETKGAEGL